MTNALAAVLHAARRAEDRDERMVLYGQFVGAWSGTLRHLRDGEWSTFSCDVDFGWVLDGRAVQDVWVARTPGGREVMHGTTLRVLDPARGVWHVVWVDTVSSAVDVMIGAQSGHDIVQDHLHSDHPVQWVFTDIEPDSFRWLNRDRADGDSDWSVTTEITLERRPPG
jgi:hypothetical protein